MPQPCDFSKPEPKHDTCYDHCPGHWPKWWKKPRCEKPNWHYDDKPSWMHPDEEDDHKVCVCAAYGQWLYRHLCLFGQPWRSGWNVGSAGCCDCGQPATRSAAVAGFPMAQRSVWLP